MIRFALIGFGGYGWNLVKSIPGVAALAAGQSGPGAPESCRLVAAADARADQLPELVATLRSQGVAVYNDAFAMLRELRGKCDAVFVATGINTHEMFTLACLEAGFHVHLEKPPVVTVQQLDNMQAAADRAGKMIAVGFQLVHSEDVRAVKARIVEGRLGEVQSVVCRALWPRTRSYYARNNWAGKLRAGDQWVLDSPTANALAHQLTNILLFSSPREGQLARPQTVRAELYAAGEVESHDTAAIEIATAEGPKAWYFVTHASEGQCDPIIEVSATRGRARWQIGKGATIEYADGPAETVPVDGKMAVRMIANFVEAVEKGDASLLRTSLVMTRNMVVALDAAHESSGRIHRIDARYSHKAEPGAGGERTVVDGLDAVMAAAAAAPCLFGDLPSAPPWAVRTEGFAVGDYRHFPERFR